MIKLDLLRYRDSETTTNGLLFVDGKYFCHTLEDEPRLVKVYGKTRIPAGAYEIRFRTSGRLYEKYKKFSFHKGMLWLQNVPNFTYIYLHIGNTHIDTLGCILVGDSLSVDYQQIGHSTLAYIRLYKLILSKLNGQNSGIMITIKDHPSLSTSQTIKPLHT